MQIPSTPPPIITTALPQDIAAKAVPNAQAMAPLVQNAVDPTPKSEKFNTVNRDKRDSRKRRDPQNPSEENEKEGDHSVNIRI